jgi:hypothetical protein
MLIGQMLIGQMLIGQMLIGQMLIGQLAAEWTASMRSVAMNLRSGTNAHCVRW